MDCNEDKTKTVSCNKDENNPSQEKIHKVLKIKEDLKKVKISG
jgi:hypothetical protein